MPSWMDTDLKPNFWLKLSLCTLRSAGKTHHTNSCCFHECKSFVWFQRDAIAHNSPGFPIVQLREKHPVIDAVARVRDQTDKEWLLLIQVSLSAYSEHKSKAGDLQKQITWPESGVPVVHLDVLGWNTIEPVWEGWFLMNSSGSNGFGTNRINCLSGMIPNEEKWFEWVRHNHQYSLPR